LENHRIAPVFNLKLPLLCSARAREPRRLHRPCATHLLPRAALLCATCLPSARAAIPHPALALSSPLHVAPPPPLEPPRTPPVASSCSRATVPSSGPRARSGAPRELVLALAHTHFAHLSFSRALHLAKPPPQLLLAIDSRRCRLPSPIHCSSSTTVIH
jgi:hypothetical protein